MLLIRTYNRKTKELDTKVRFVEDCLCEIAEKEQLYLSFWNRNLKLVRELEEKFNKTEYVEYIKSINPTNKRNKYICVFTTNYILTFI